MRRKAMLAAIATAMSQAAGAARQSQAMRRAVAITPAFSSDMARRPPLRRLDRTSRRSSVADAACPAKRLAPGRKAAWAQLAAHVIDLPEFQRDRGSSEASGDAAILWQMCHRVRVS